MKCYELTYFITPDLSLEALRTFQEKIISFIQEEGGILDKAENLVKKKLVYPIKNKTMVYLATLNFHCESARIPSIEKKLKAESQILRYLILTKKVPKAELKPEVKKISRWKPLPKKITKPEEKKVELEEIEKKLEEILGE